MRIGVPAESRPGERRVAATPQTVSRLIDLGYDVAVQSGAGVAAHYPDEEYAEAGAELVTATQAWGADLVVQINPVEPEDVLSLQPGAILVGQLEPGRRPDLVAELTTSQVTALALDAVPRISRAQSLDVLSSMTNLAGYRAVVEAAHQFGSVFTGQVTAAGNVPPATVFVIGAGVAGLAAIGTAVSLGAQVRAFDIRPEVAEQVRSMGATFAEIDLGEVEQRTDGYAAEMTQDVQARAMEVYARECAEADIVITTAAIPGRPAPTLITADMVSSMRPGSVIVDMASASGGNCELTVPGEVITTANKVQIVGYADLAARLPSQASQLYGSNVVSLLELLTPAKDGQVVLDLDDEVLRGLTVAHLGETLWPPPQVSVTAAPAPAAEAPPSEAATVAAPPPAKKKDPRRRYAVAGLAAVAFALVASVAPPAFLGHVTVFTLAVIVGFYVITNVTHALHTPLLAETNAISGIILVGALLQVGNEDPLVRTLAVLATVVASINVFGGFAVTGRMLKMFRRGEA